MLERSRDAPVGYRLESLGVTGPLGGGSRLVPATNFGVELLAVLAPDPVIQRPAVL